MQKEGEAEEEGRMWVIKEGSASDCAPHNCAHGCGNQVG